MPELPLTMPKMSMTMEEGTMVSWLKAVGDAVRAGEPVCEVATDKVDMEVESPFDGTLVRIVAEADEVLPVGATIAFISTDADDLLGGLFDAPAPEAEATTPSSTSSEPSSVAATSPLGDWVASVPQARGMAERAGIDLHDVPPTGQWASVRVSDVETAIGAALQASVATPPFTATSEPQHPTDARRRRTRAQVAKVMAASAAVPQFTAFADLDLSQLAPVRKTLLGGASWTAILVRAQALALAENPDLNGHWTDSGVERSNSVGIALAVDSPSGLIAPVLVDPQRLSLAALVRELAEIIEATRTGSVPVNRLSGGTSVFSNLGGLGVDSFNALLTPPQATALSVGAVKNVVVVRDDGAFAPRLICRVGLTVDHRVADGADAARFLARLSDLISDPSAVA